jgi:hypothetical protein
MTMIMIDLRRSLGCDADLMAEGNKERMSLNFRINAV